ncbi:MAG: glycoside hydrolase family 1 protein [Candidatus Doudnabacteria bacterium]|nr:glycoside hydrolase family 1 protein [Candidatus Doudnabacteria bacterium]
MSETAAEKTFHLPASFLYGAALSAHQVEGGNVHSDWWEQEQLGSLPKSGVATDHYNRYAEDFALAKQIGLNALRVSIEWSRIEPAEGQWDQNAVEHYRAVLRELQQQGLTRMVTLHHFTLPLWLAKQGGFANAKAIYAFRTYARFIAQELGSEIDLWVTINEPEVYTLMSHIRGVWPPFSKNPLTAFTVFRNMTRAHNAAYQQIKHVFPFAQVGIAKNNVHYEPHTPSRLLDRAAVRASHWFSNHWFLNQIQNNLDFIGVNYYFYNSLSVTLRGVEQKSAEKQKCNMGGRTFPEGMYHTLMDLARAYGKPIYITENGIANATDAMRRDFIREHLFWTSKAIQHGADVRGYFYWSLTDAYEWQDGLDPKFGLIEIDFHTLTRTMRPHTAFHQN